MKNNMWGLQIHEKTLQTPFPSTKCWLIRNFVCLNPPPPCGHCPSFRKTRRECQDDKLEITGNNVLLVHTGVSRTVLRVSSRQMMAYLPDKFDSSVIGKLFAGTKIKCQRSDLFLNVSKFVYCVLGNCAAQVIRSPM